MGANQEIVWLFPRMLMMMTSAPCQMGVSGLQFGFSHRDAGPRHNKPRCHLATLITTIREMRRPFNLNVIAALILFARQR